MPMVQLTQNQMYPVSKKNFRSEKKLQNLVEINPETIVNCRFVASEFSTGSQYTGPFDTLSLSEHDNLVIIEDKKIESSDWIHQGLFYLSRIDDHRGVLRYWI